MSSLVNGTLRKLREGMLCVGAKPILARTPEAGKIFQACGFDWMALDLEHSGHNVSSVADMSLAALDQGITAFARVPGLEPNLINQVICNGAMGVIVPRIETADEARSVVDAVRFPPLGNGGVPSFFPHFRYARIAYEEAISCLNREVMVVILLESERAIANAHDIAAVDGVNVVHIGANDLVQPLSQRTPEARCQIIENACQTVVEATRAHGKFAGIGGLADRAEWRKIMRLGFQFISGTTDSSLLRDGARNWVGFLENLHSPGSGDPKIEQE